MKVISSSNPKQAFKEAIAPLERRGKIVSPSAWGYIQDHLEELRTKYNCAPTPILEIPVTRAEVREELMTAAERIGIRKAKKRHEKFTRNMRRSDRNMQRVAVHIRHARQNEYGSRSRGRIQHNTHTVESNLQSSRMRARDKTRVKGVSTRTARAERRMFVSANNAAKQRSLLKRSRTMRGHVDADTFVQRVERTRVHPRKLRREQRKIVARERKAKRDENREYVERVIASRNARRERRRLQKEAQRIQIISESYTVDAIKDIFPEWESNVDIRAIMASISELQIPEGIKTFGTSVVVGFCNWMYQMWRSRNYTDYISATTAFIMQFDIVSGKLDSLVANFVQWFVTYAREFVVRITPESWTDTAQRGLTFVETLLISVHNSEFFSKVRNFLVTVMSLKIFDKDITSQLRNIFGKPGKLSILEIITNVIDVFRYMIRFAASLVEGKPIYDVFLGTDPISDAMKKGNTLISIQDMVYQGLHVEGYVEKTQYLRDITELLEAMEILTKDISRFDTRKESFLLLKNQLYRLKQEVTMSFRGPRVPPVAIILHSVPGVGKSELTLQLARWFCEFRGYPFDQSLIFNRNQESEYHEGYGPGTPIIHYSELGNKKSDIVKHQGDVCLPELQSLIDSLAFSANMAFEGKGKVWMTPELVLIDTNNPTLNAEHVMTDLGAFMRRFISIEVSVKNQYRIEGGVGLDVEKSLADTTSYILDRYVFSVSKYVPTNTPSRPRVEGVMTGDIFDLHQYLQGRFTDHFAKKSTLADRLKEQSFQEFYAARTYQQQVEEKGYVPLPQSADMEQQHVLITSESFDVDAEDTYRQECESKGYVPTPLNNSRRNDILPDNLTPPINKETGQSLMQFFYDVAIEFCSCIYYLLLDQFDNIGFMFFLRLFLLLSLYMGLKTVILAFVGLTFYKPSPLVFLPNFKGLFPGARVWREKASKSWNRLKYLTMSVPYNQYEIPSWSKYVAIFASISIIVRMVKVYMDNKIHITAQGMVSNFSDVPTDKLHQVEESMDIAPCRTRVKGKREAIWNDMDPSGLSNMVHTNDATSLFVHLSRNVRVVEVVGATVQRSHIFGIRGTYAIVNKHLLDKENVTIIITKNTHLYENFSYDGAIRLSLSRQHWYDMGNDMVMFDTRTIHFKDITKHLLTEYPTFKNISGAIGSVRVVVSRQENLQIHAADGLLLNGLGYSYIYQGHGPGTCGLPVLIENANRSAIVGIHIGCADATATCYASPLMQQNVFHAMSEIARITGLVPVLGQHCEVDFDECIEEPNHKSVFRYESLHYIDYFGKEVGNVLVNKRSNLKRVKGMESVHRVLESIGIPWNNQGVRPLMRAQEIDGNYVSPYNYFYKKANNGPPSLDLTILNRVIDDIVSEQLSMLRNKGITRVTPVTMDDAINGAVNDAYMRRINPSTASGYGFEGKKSRHLVLDEATGKRQPTPEVLDAVIRIFDLYKDGDCYGPINEGNLKDAVVTAEKYLKGGTRVFFAGELPFLIVCRMILSPYYTLMVEHNDVFLASVGIDMHRGADALIREMYEFSPHFLEGDYSGYDVRTPPDIARAANTVIYRVLEGLGYNNTALQVLQGILSDDMFPIITLLRDLFSKPGLVTSGRYGTAESNCLRNQILVRYAWCSVPELRDLPFREYVKLTTYGDDVLMAVRPDVLQYFNNIVYSDLCAQLYDMEFTTTNKGDEHVPSLTIDECSFLKRNFRLHPSGKYLAPLSSDSIHNALEWYLPSFSVSKQDQIFSCCISMCYEVFLHVDENDFNLFRDSLINFCMRELEVPFVEEIQQRLPSYNKLYSSFFEDMPYTGDATTPDMESL